MVSADLISPPEAFLEQVKQVLEHLYDFPYLQRHPLAQSLATKPSSPETAGRQLRHEFINAIEALNPDKKLFFREPQARLYNLLYFYYVEGLTLQDTSDELGLSIRQVYRDLKQGHMRVAEVIWAGRQRQPVPGPASGMSGVANGMPGAANGTTSIADMSSVQAEVARLQLSVQQADLNDLLEGVGMALDRLASARSVELRLNESREPLPVTTDIAVAQQVLVDILSNIINQVQPAYLELDPSLELGSVKLRIHYPADGSPIGESTSPVVDQLVAQLGWTVQEGIQGNSHVITLEMTVNSTTVLIIDDNKALSELVDRYLTNNNCQVLTAASGAAGWELAQTVVPDVIILDVMMPEMNGWELLQRLRSHPETSAIPVIICSVFNNPDLAYSLGATRFLPKPVKQEDILACLTDLGLV